MDCPSGFWCFQLKDFVNTLVLIVTIIAVYIGPIRAVQITRENDLERERTRRQIEIFSNLMKTRRVTLDPLHVMSLNLIEVEFHGSSTIIQAYRAYIDTLAKPVPSSQSSADQDMFRKDREDTFFNLLHAIGQHLKFSFDKRDLDKFSYVPQGWQNVEYEQQNFRQLAIELLLGRRALPVTQFNVAEVNKKFPPPPVA